MPTPRGAQRPAGVHWTVVDRIIDSYLQRGVRPSHLQIGFMPQAALSSAPAGTPYQHSWRPAFATSDRKQPGTRRPRTTHGRIFYRGPALRGALGTRRGRPGTSRSGTSQHRLLERQCRSSSTNCTTTPWRALCRALPEARVGPDVASHGGAFMDAFCSTWSAAKPRDWRDRHADGLPVLPRQGQPRFVDGHVRMGMAVAEGHCHRFPEDRGRARAEASPSSSARTTPKLRGCPGPQNAYRNGTMYSSYTAASYKRIWQLAARHGVNLEGALTWAFPPLRTSPGLLATASLPPWR